MKQFVMIVAGVFVGLLLFFVILPFAAIVMIGGSELVRDLAEYRMLIFGLALVVMMVLRPKGLVSGRLPSVSLGKAKEISAELVAQGRG